MQTVQLSINFNHPIFVKAFASVTNSPCFDPLLVASNVAANASVGYLNWSCNAH